MFCPKCGTACADDAAFCHKCGKEIPQTPVQSREKVADKKEPAAMQPQVPVNRAPSNDSSAVFPENSVAARPQKQIKLEPVAPTKRQILSSFGAVGMLTLMYLYVIAPAFDGQKFNFAKEGGGFLIITAICYWYLFKTRGFKGWLGGIFGVVSSFGVLVVAAVIAAHSRNSPAYILEHTPQIAALQKSHPKEYDRIANEIAAAKERGESSAEIQALAGAKILPITNKAIQSTSDGAILEYAQAKVKMFRAVAAKSADDCALLMSGKATEAGAGVLVRIFASVPEETMTAMKKSLARVITESGAFETVPDTKTEMRLNFLYEQIDAKLKVRGTSVYFLGDEKKSADVRCKAGLGLFEEAQSLPVADRTFMLRQLLGSG